MTSITVEMEVEWYVVAVAIKEEKLMAPYTYDKLPGEPILIYTALEGFKIGAHLKQSIDDAWKALDAQEEPVYYINDLSRQARLSLDELLTAASALTRGETAPYHHPKIRKLIIVTKDTMLKLSYKGASADAFGNLHAEVFGTLEEALEYARSQI